MTVILQNRRGHIQKAAGSVESKKQSAAGDAGSATPTADEDDGGLRKFCHELTFLAATQHRDGERIA